ncbi:hypothetical protein BGZ99_002093 [Dissophora globulifera]|uniref:Uncharacterized protein n=1 Tax=Dissophora globulifera TaxID=979702 RepID=A0A9P6QWY6_9FUNG|nr:hypothetical protein BGZ99_002093 [Dissophora globulifera]
MEATTEVEFRSNRLKQNQTTTPKNNLSPKPPTSITMTLFKSFKNQSASATASPAATPRTSMHEERPAAATKMTQEQALEILNKISMPNAALGAFIR